MDRNRKATSALARTLRLIGLLSLCIGSQWSLIELVSAADEPNKQSNYCADKLCYGLPKGCLEASFSSDDTSPAESECQVFVTSKTIVNPNSPNKKEILFELFGKSSPISETYVAVGFSETAKMSGLVSECIQSDQRHETLKVITLRHSFNIPTYQNVPVNITSGIKHLGVSQEEGSFNCRWFFESSVGYTYEAPNGSLISGQVDLGYRSFHILLATGLLNPTTKAKEQHSDRISSLNPIYLAQTGPVKTLGSHILLRIHGSMMIIIWVGLVTISVVLARYYKNEWYSSRINNLAIWFVVHRTLMIAAWFGSIIAVIFAYMYTETYHPGPHSLSGTACLFLSTLQVISGLVRPSLDSSRRPLFNWIHFICGNLSYLLAMTCLVTASFLPPAHLPASYIWVIAMFVAFYTVFHLVMTLHQFVCHKSSKISITHMSDLDTHSPKTYADACGFVTDTYHKDSNGLRQFMIGILVTVAAIFIVALVTLVNLN